MDIPAPEHGAWDPELVTQAKALSRPELDRLAKEASRDDHVTADGHHYRTCLACCAHYVWAVYTLDEET